MTRLVRGADGRMWTVHSRIEWRNPVESDDFEHDVSGGALPGIMMAGMLVVMVVVLIAWTPEQVVVPAWLILALIFLFAFFPVRWALRRPHMLVAESKGGDESPPERWMGYVRGPLAVRQEANQVIRTIEMYKTPNLDGPLQPVD
jgi:hypothetical protein